MRLESVLLLCTEMELRSPLTLIDTSRNEYQLNDNDVVLESCECVSHWHAIATAAEDR